ncbi:MAG: CbtA family protein [bacterium]|nr:CbtA family protein [bacterium]MCY3637277.1 CbtA family protein [bacterium]MYH71819.1 CbtA family protein [Acidimicrobiia bacterium]
MAVETWTQRLGRGAIAGSAGGAVSAVVLWLAVEPSITKAIDLENAAAEGHSHGDDGELISRTTQLIGGTVTSIVVGVLFGVVFAVVYARSQHRLAGFTDLGRSVSLAALAFSVVALLPALKVPANPPAVGDPGTVNDRTLTYLAIILFGLVLVGVSFAAAQAVRRRTERAELWWAAGICVAVVGGALILYLAPSGNVDIPATMPASLVWKFRIGSLGQHAAMWLGIALAYGALAHRRSLARQPSEAPATAAWAE